MKIRIRILVLLSLLCWTGVAIAVDMPPNWPWRGINLDNVESGVKSRVEFYIRRLRLAHKTLKLNSVQLRLRPRKLVEWNKMSPHDAWQQSLEWADVMLDECKKLGIVAILSVEGFPIDPAVGYDHTSPRFWYDSDNLADVITLASDISKRFSNRGVELVAYQLLSEPVMRLGSFAINPPMWRSFLTDIINTIRKNDPVRWIAVSQGPWGLPSGYADFKTLPYKNIIYGAHMYTPHVFTHQGIRKYKEKITYPGRINKKMWNPKALVSALSLLRTFQLEHNVPVWIGEFSAIRWAPGGEDYIKDVVKIFNNYNWAWTYFSLNGWHGWNPDYNDRLPIEGNVNKQKMGTRSRRWSTLKEIFTTTPKQLKKDVSGG